MTLTRVWARNFKSFERLDVKLGPLTVLIGANASGKSNFLAVLQFLKGTAQMGFANSVRAHGGMRYLRNIHSRSNEVEIGVEARSALGPLSIPGASSSFPSSHRSVDQVTTSYWIRFSLPGNEKFPRVLSERLAVAYSRPPIGKSTKARTKRSVARIEITRNAKRIVLRTRRGEALPPQLAGLIAYLRAVREIPIAETVSLIDNPTTQPFIGISFPDLFGSAFYRLEPSKEKEMTTSIGLPFLNVDGSNLAFVAWNIAQDPEKKQRFLRLIRDFLPYVADIEVNNIGQNLLLNLAEEGSRNRPLPASLLSDGTLNTIALAIAMYFEPRPLIVLEEPEKSIHPRLLARLLNSVVSISKTEQVILTTHSAEVLRHVPIESLLLLSRDHVGNTSATRPTDNSRLRAFLKEELGIPELFTLGQLS